MSNPNHSRRFFRRKARSEGAAEGGCGGNSAAPERSAGAKRRRSVGVLRKMGSDFFKQTPPNETLSELRKRLDRFTKIKAKFARKRFCNVASSIKKRN